MGFSRQEYWSGLPFPSHCNLPDPGIELASPVPPAPPAPPALQEDSLPVSPQGSTLVGYLHKKLETFQNKIWLSLVKAKVIER